MPETMNNSETTGTDGPFFLVRRLSRKGRALLWVVLAFVIAGFAVWFFTVRDRREGPLQSAPVVVTTTPDAVLPVSEQPIAAVPDSEAPYESEHYRVGEIAIGGEFGLLVPESDPSPLGIFSVRGEAFSEKKRNASKLVITWETNKPARSEISYGKGVGQADGVIREEEYGTSHSVVIPDLSQASTYVYRISANDQWGNVTESDLYAVYTGARDISLFELMAGAIGDVFGWAVDR